MKHLTHMVCYHKENNKIDDILDPEADMDVAIHSTAWFIAAIFVLQSAISGFSYTEVAE